MLTVKEAAAVLRVSAALVYSLCSQGMLEHERYGIGRGTIRIRPEALDAFQQRAKVSTLHVTPAASCGHFKELDRGRLIESWKKRGVLKDAKHA